MKLSPQNSIKVAVSIQSFHFFVGPLGCLVGITVLQRAEATSWLVPELLSFVVVAFCVALLAVVKRQKLIAASVLLFTCGALIGGQRFYLVADAWRTEATRITAQSGTVIQGEITSQPVLDTLERGNKLSFNFSPNGYDGHVAVNWYRAADLFPQRGEQWLLPLNVKPPDGFDNVGVARYSAWLAASNVIGRGYLSGSDSASRVSDAQTLVSAASARDRLAEVVGYWLDERPARPVIQTLVTGEKNKYSDRLVQHIRAAGISHLLAISGLHIGIVAALGALLGRLMLWLVAGLAGWQPSWWGRRAWTLLAAGVVALGYAWVSGFAIPTQRALLMLAAASCCLLLLRRPQPFYLLAWVLLGVILFDPMAPLLAGFWLSFLAVTIILLLLSGRKYPVRQYASRLDSRLAWAWRQTRLLVKLQLALSLGLMPVTMLFFSQVSLVSPLANLVAVPAFSLLVVPIALVSTVAGTLWLPLAAPLVVAERLANGVLRYTEWLLNVAGQWAVWTSGTIGSLGVALILIGMLMIYLPSALALRGLGVWLVAVCLLSPVSGVKPRPAEGEFRLTMLDVGHGLAVHIQTANRDVVYDSGVKFASGNSAANIVISPYLRSLGVTTIDQLIISHSDNDHSGGIDTLEAQFEIGDRLGWQGRACIAGDQWQFDGVGFEVVSPALPSAHNSNDESCVILVEGLGGSALLSGDVERKAERQMLSRLKPVDLVTVPHHGSKSSSHPAWVEQLAPRIALVSSADRGRFNLPNDSVVKRYQTESAALYLTKESGSISVFFSLSGDVSLTKSRDSSPWWLAGLR